MVLEASGASATVRQAIVLQQRMATSANTVNLHLCSLESLAIFACILHAMPPVDVLAELRASELRIDKL
jgi:hypothetical protein